MWCSRQYRNLEPDEKVVKEQVEKLSAKLDAYEVILSKQKYLGGEVSSRRQEC